MIQVACAAIKQNWVKTCSHAGLPSAHRDYTLLHWVTHTPDAAALARGGSLASLAQQGCSVSVNFASLVPYPTFIGSNCLTAIFIMLCSSTSFLKPAHVCAVEAMCSTLKLATAAASAGPLLGMGGPSLDAAAAQAVSLLTQLVHDRDLCLRLLETSEVGQGQGRGGEGLERDKGLGQGLGQGEGRGRGRSEGGAGRGRAGLSAPSIPMPLTQRGLLPHPHLIIDYTLVAKVLPSAAGSSRPKASPSLLPCAQVGSLVASLASHAHPGVASIAAQVYLCCTIPVSVPVSAFPSTKTKVTVIEETQGEESRDFIAVQKGNKREKTQCVQNAMCARCTVSFTRV